MPPMTLRRTFLKNSTSRTPLLVGTVLLALMTVASGGCGKNKAAQSSQTKQLTQVYVRLDTLTARHPLAATLRDLDTAAAQLRRNAVSVSPTAATNLPAIPATSSLSGGATPTDVARNRAARRKLLASARDTLRDYANALEMVRLRIAEEEEAELKAIANTNSATEEREARQRAEDQTKTALFDEADEDGKLQPNRRAYRYLNTQVQRNAADINRRDGNVISIAREEKPPHLPSDTVLEQQITTLDTDPKARVSDQARLTYTLRKLDEALKRFQQDDEDFEAAGRIQFERDLALIRAKNAAWVKNELAKSTAGKVDQAQLVRLQTELTQLLRNLTGLEKQSAASAIQYGAGATGQLTENAITLPRSSGIGTTVTTFVRLAREREALRNVIRRDTETAVRDVAAAHSLSPFFQPSNGGKSLPDRTSDFAQWIFPKVRNVAAVSMSKEGK